MKLKPCGCGGEHYFRIPRTWWMRLSEDRRLYRCRKCEAVLFVPYQSVSRWSPDATIPATHVQDLSALSSPPGGTPAPHA
jgi:hypothetical protein